jgi:hypothetical protein
MHRNRSRSKAQGFTAKVRPGFAESRSAAKIAMM